MSQKKIDCFVYCKITFPITVTKGSKNVPAAQCPFAQIEVHKDVVCQGWIGRTQEVCTEPWVQPNWTNFGWIGMLSVHQVPCLPLNGNTILSSKVMPESCYQRTSQLQGWGDTTLWLLPIVFMFHARLCFVLCPSSNLDFCLTYFQPLTNLLILKPLLC